MKTPPNDFMLHFILPGEQALIEIFGARFAFAHEYRGKDDLRLYVARGMTVRVLAGTSLELEKARRN